MEVLFFTIVVILFLQIIRVCVRSKFPDLPGPTFRQYLPHGDTFPMYMDSSRMLTVIVTLCKKYGDVFQVWLGPLDTVVTALPGDIAHILSATHCFERPPAMTAMFETVVPDSIMGMPRSTHLAARRHLRGSFNYSHLSAFHDTMSAAVLELCQTLAQLSSESTQSAAEVNISEHVAVVVNRIITNAAFGWELSKEENLYFAKCTDHLVDEMMRDFVGYPFRQMLTRLGTRKQLFRVRERVRRFCRTLVMTRLNESRQRKACRSSDLLDAIISMETCDTERITSQLIVFAVAGAHTTIETIAWSIFETCRHPEVIAKIQKEINQQLCDLPTAKVMSHSDVRRLTYLKYVWNETLRLHPPGPMFLRHALVDTVLPESGVFVPAGASVVALAQGSHRSSNVWTMPHHFLPERWGPDMNEGDKAPPGAFVPFSLGSRNCAGRFFADHEGILILAELHRRFEFRLACQPEKVTTCCGWVADTRNNSNGKDGKAGLPVYLRCRVAK